MLVHEMAQEQTSEAPPAADLLIAPFGRGHLIQRRAQPFQVLRGQQRLPPYLTPAGLQPLMPNSMSPSKSCEPTAVAPEREENRPMPPAATQTLRSIETTASLPHRRFGKTEEQVPVIGLGTGPAGMGLSDEEAVALYHAAIDRGVTYLDTAPGYGRAHLQLGQVLPTRRDEVFLATKCYAGTAADALRIHEQSLADLRTDLVDLLYAHCVGSFDPEQLLAPHGVFAGLREAQRRGWTRFIGFTAHHHPGKSLRLLDHVEVDAVMLAMNYADRHTYGFEERILPCAHALDLGVAAMKVYGGAREMEYKTPRPSALGERNHRPALRYALGLPGVAVAVIGMYTVEELERNIAWAHAWEPLTGEEQERLDADGRAVAAEWGPHFGAVE
jgi:predicted aldo/keto reductase-like oxidoreductase